MNLAAEHGNEVRVSYDIHDANSVIVHCNRSSSAQCHLER
ncbi:Mu transposase C-terminal domain-containing protein [Escherichia coli]